MSRILATAGAEARIALRNRWVAIAVAMMAIFSLVLSAAGSALVLPPFYRTLRRLRFELR